jgi:mannose-6-phosphate isomerase-like protein (cupin superfamily)
LFVVLGFYLQNQIMRSMALTLILLGASISLAAQTPPAQKPPAQTPPAQTPPAQTPPAQTPPTPRPATPAPRPAARVTPTNLTFQVSDTLGAPLSNVQVTTPAPLAREGVTGNDGSLRFTGVRAGTYRVRFAREGSITLERDITVRNGESLTIDVALSAAPPPPKAPEPVKVEVPVPAQKELPPPGDPKIVPIPVFLEKNFIGREGRKDSALGCTPTSTATLHQLREAWLSHTHDDADEWIYVVAGEGTLRIGGAEQRISAGTFSLVPHTIAHALLPTGRNPLIVISIVSGPACGGAL